MTSYLIRVSNYRKTQDPCNVVCAASIVAHTMEPMLAPLGRPALKGSVFRYMLGALDKVPYILTALVAVVSHY
jgi:hypothetical protein